MTGDDGNPAERAAIFAAIDRERAYQDAKWGTIQQNPHTIGDWIFIAYKELCEADTAAASLLQSRQKEALAELLQAAAVIVACLEQHGIVERADDHPDR